MTKAKKETAKKETTNANTPAPIIPVSLFNSRALSQVEIEELLRDNSIADYVIDETGEAIFSISPTSPILRVPMEKLRDVKMDEIPSLMAKIKGVGQLSRISVKAVELADKTRCFAIVNGMQRTKVCELLGWNVKVQTEQKANLLHSVLHNIGVVRQSVNEVYNSIATCVQQGMSFPEIAEYTGYDVDKVQEHFKLGLLAPDFRQDVLSGKIGFLVGKEIANAINSGKFTTDQIAELYSRSNGTYIDPALGKLEPASVENIKSAKRSYLAVNKQAEKGAIDASGKKAIPPFNHEPELIQTRLDETIERYKTFKSQEEAQGFESLDDEQAAIVKVFDYLMNMRAEDIQTAYLQYCATWKLNPENGEAIGK